MNDIVFLLINGITVACIYGLVAVAVSISWTTHKSVIWAIIHGMINWLYIMYYLITN